MVTCLWIEDGIPLKDPQVTHSIENARCAARKPHLAGSVFSQVSLAKPGAIVVKKDLHVRLRSKKDRIGS